jgi:hypothetical protein
MTPMMNAEDICQEEQWLQVLKNLPSDLDQSAREGGALVRKRRVPNAAALIRVALAYALTNLSIKDVAAWATAQGVIKITGPSLFYRFRGMADWLATVLARILSDQCSLPKPSGFCVRVIDATVITGPGSKGTDWRAHVLIDPVSGRFESVELTDNKGGESFSRIADRPGELDLGDRGYCTARGIASRVRAGADVLVRVNPCSIKVCDLNKKRLNLGANEARVPRTGRRSWKVLIPVPPDMESKKGKAWKLHEATDWIRARLVATRTKPNTVLWLLTTVDKARLSDKAMVTLYRLRWQIELLFKRLKTLVGLGDLPTRDGPTAKTWILARLLAAAIAQRMVEPSGFSP